ncbi:MAG: prepilin-type N-terminal cleavage/methylation domain-containing protein [Limisphaerales bacterium]
MTRTRERERTFLVHGKKTERKTGFTLIELLVVMAIIAILAAMLLPALAKSKAQAQSIVCKNHLHEMAIALEMYTEDATAYPCYGYSYYAASTFTWGTVHWPNALLPYYKLGWDNPVYHCPAYNGAISIVTNFSAPPLGSYSYNVLGTKPNGEPDGQTNYPCLGLGVGVYYSDGPGGMSQPQSEKAVLSPSEMFAMMDTGLEPPSPGVPIQSNTNDFLILGQGLSGRDFGSPYYYDYDFLQQLNGKLVIQHGRVLNVVCADGHVTTVTPFDLSADNFRTARNWNADNKPHPETWGVQ